MNIGRILGWLALLVTALACTGWLLTAVLVLGRPAADVLRSVAPNSTAVTRWAERLPASPFGSIPYFGAEESPEDAEGAATEDESAENDATLTDEAPTDEEPSAVPDPERDSAGRAADDGGTRPALDDGFTGDVVDPGITPAVDWPDFTAYDGLAEREPRLQTLHFNFLPAADDDQLLVAAVDRWAPEVEDLYAYVKSRAGVELGEDPIYILFDRSYAARCPARGLAVPSAASPYMVVYLDEGTPDVQVRAVLAHEIAHHLFGGPEFVGDGVLTEGMANWAAGEYALRWQGLDSWDQAARRYLDDGTYVSVADEGGQLPRRGEDCIARRDRVYNVRSAFVGWLVDRHGVEMLRAMPAETLTRMQPLTGTMEEMEVPDYVSATGHSLTQLERMWLVELRQGQ